MKLALDVAPLDLSLDSAEPDSPPRRADLEKDPVLGVKKLLQRETGGPATGSVSAPKASPPRQIPDLLPELARTYGASFIADAYWRSAPVFGLPPAGEPIALFTLLDRLARPVYHWDWRGPLIRLRSRRWFLDRPREVPLRLVRRWRALLAQHASLPLETYLEVAAVLRDEQLASLGELTAAGVLPRELPDLQEIDAARHALRLYASLTLPQREALRRGAALPFERLLPVQRELFLAAVRENSRYRTPPLDRTEWVAGSFSLASERYTRVQEEQAGASHYRREEGMAAGAPPPAAPRAPGESVLPSLPGAPAAPSASPPVRVTRHPVTRAWFIAERGAERLRLGFITIPTPS
jgi:hypothetical protein